MLPLQSVIFFILNLLPALRVTYNLQDKADAFNRKLLAPGDGESDTVLLSDAGSFGRPERGKAGVVAQRLCPWWAGYFLLCPLRRLAQNPRTLFAPLVAPGATVLELGPAMGFFTLDLARLVGSRGRVVTVDIQRSMLEAIEKRAAKAGLLHRIEPHLGGNGNAWADDLTGQVDVALAIYMLHEVPDQASFFAAIRSTLVPDGKLFISEPIGHVSKRDYEKTVAEAENEGFETIGRPAMRFSRSVLMARR